VYDASDPIGVFFSRSTDGGHTFFPPILVAYPGIVPSLARREGTPPEEEDLYVVFYDARRVLFTYSPDAGRTWTLPIVVYDGTLFDTIPMHSKTP
ncbi:MAG: sialidase family protein, partial [Candidatus Methanomethyliaceae archaeon]